MKHSVTINDVARLAGVSKKTVSRVLNSEAYVTEATRSAVLKAIADLEYRPNLAARSLAVSRSFLVGLIVMRMDAYVFQSVHRSCIRACRERGLHVIVEELSTIDSNSLQYLEHSLRQTRFEGVIIMQIADRPEILDLLERLKIRYVRISPRIDLDRSDSVTSNYDEGMKQLAEHFWQLGHRRIALASAIDQWLDPIRDYLIELGCDREQILSLPMNWEKPAGEAGRELAVALLAQRERPTAIFAFNDEVAAGLITYAWGHGVSIPRDLSVAGYDDADLSRHTYPPLTTIRQPFDDIVRAAVTLLTEPAEDGKPRQVVCPVQLIVRDSTGSVGNHNI